jgi:hypothetical protein
MGRGTWNRHQTPNKANGEKISKHRYLHTGRFIAYLTAKVKNYRIIDFQCHFIIQPSAAVGCWPDGQKPRSESSELPPELVISPRSRFAMPQSRASCRAVERRQASSFRHPVAPGRNQGFYGHVTNRLGMAQQIAVGVCPYHFLA